MNASSLRWGISYSALLWALAVCTPQPALSAPQETVLYSFTGGPDGAYPMSELTITKSGALIGTASQGGDLSGCGGKGCGVVFELKPPAPGNREWKETVLHRFLGGDDGAAPLAGVLMDKTGALYGVTSEGGGGLCYSYKSYISVSSNGSAFQHWKKGAQVGCGTIFKLTSPTIGHPVWTETVLHAFAEKDGRFPAGVPLMDKTGALYGVTSEGGEGHCGLASVGLSSPYPYRLRFRTGCGTVFRLTPPADGRNAWSLTTLHEFTSKPKPDGAFPVGVRYATDGSLLGTTRGNFFDNARAYAFSYYYGSHRYWPGTVFKLTPPASGRTVWTQTILYVFPGKFLHGPYPQGRLYQDPAGALFGTTADGGSASAGSAFQLSPPSKRDKPWAETDLHSFGTGRDGAVPGAGLIGDAATGALYGDTAGGGGIGCGGSHGCGTVFSLKPPAAGRTSWTEAVLHRFGRANDGQNPQARLTMDKAGNLYGTAAGGGAHLYGTVFKVSP